MTSPDIATRRSLYDAGVEIEPFASRGLRVLGQAVELRNLVRSQPWLADIQPGTLRRYARFHQGLKNIPRLASKPDEINPYIIHRNGAAQGIATLIFNQEVEHPDKGKVAGTNLDYWLKNEHQDDQGFHATVAGLLIRASNHTGEGAVFATILPDHPFPAIGFREILHRVGRPAVLSTPEAGDPHGITKGGVPLHLYAFGQPLTR